ncbi:MAG: hypothetical protein ACP5I8_12665 [Phycisphaerae bacterium]
MTTLIKKVRGLKHHRVLFVTLVGIGCVTIGAGIIYPPASLIVLGLICLTDVATGGRK